MSFDKEFFESFRDQFVGELKSLSNNIYTGFEQLDNKIDLSNKQLNERMDKLESRMDNLDRRMDNLEQHISEVDKQLFSNEASLESFQEKMLRQLRGISDLLLGELRSLSILELTVKRMEGQLKVLQERVNWLEDKGFKA